VNAVDARTGELVWVNDDTGAIYMPQPHGGANAESGIAAQGHLVATEEHLLVPNGRAVPASFRRADGEFEYFHLQANSPAGGTATMASGKVFFNSGRFFHAKTGLTGGDTGSTAIAGLPDGVVTATPQGITAFRWGEPDPERGTRSLEKRFEAPVALADRAVIVAGNRVVAGGEDRVSIVDLETGERTWSFEVYGTVHGLAASDGRLFVSTDEGQLYCFAEEVPEWGLVEHWPETGPAYAHLGLDEGDAYLAGGMLTADTGVSEGYCLDVAAGDGRDAYGLALATNLHIIALESDPEKVAIARRELTAAGLYGTRVTVHQASAEDLRAYPPCFADLIIASRGGPPLDRDVLTRLARPGGGVIHLGGGDPEIREPLEGAGSWTHQYADAANTVCSGDSIRGPLGMLWYRDLDQDLPQRHGRGPSPLYLGGRIFSLGMDSLVAVDAYNGRLLWEHPFPGILHAYHGDHLMGTSGSHSPYCVSEEAVHVRRDDRCVLVDPETGAEKGVFRAPTGPDGEPGIWGFIACEGGILFGSLANPEHVVTFRYVQGGDLSTQLTESTTFFALDAETGEEKWVYRAEHSIRHNAIAIGGGRVYLIDRPLATFDLTKEEEPADQRPSHESGTLLCLDAETGRPLWEVDEDVYGTLLVLGTAHDSLLMGYQPTRFRLESEVGGRMAVFDARTGERRWDEEVRYDSRPTLVDRTIYAQGGAWDLLSGEERPFDFSRSYGCGILAAGLELLVFRSATFGYFELDLNERTENFGGIRPGCWINAIPAGGLVLAPDGTTDCVCSYQNRAWIALAPEDLRLPSAVPASGGFAEPVRVELRAREPEAEVRYTLDGTTPTEASPRFTKPFLVEETGKLKMRSFRDGSFPSPVASAEFVIDPLLLPLDEKRWRVWGREPPVNSPPGRWTTSGDTVTQHLNIHSPIPEGADPTKLPNYGSLRIFEDGSRWTDGELRLQIRSPDNDGIGVAFRVRDEHHHYLLHMDSERRFRTLAVRDGDEFRVLAEDRIPYRVGAWLDLRVVLEGPRIEVFLDGERILYATDGTHPRGTIALHSWGSTGVQFRRITFDPR